MYWSIAIQHVDPNPLIYTVTATHSPSACIIQYCPEICDLSLAEGTSFAGVLKSRMDLGKLWLNWRWEQELLLYIMFVTHPNLPFLGSKGQNPQARTNKEHYTSTEKKRGYIVAHFILLTTWLLWLPVRLTWTLLNSTEQIYNHPEAWYLCSKIHAINGGTDVPRNCNSPAFVKLGVSYVRLEALPLLSQTENNFVLVALEPHT